MRDIHHFIDGQQTAGQGSERGAVFNPTTGEQQAQVALGSTADVDSAVAAAKAAFPEWAATTPLRRARILFKYKALLDEHRDELARLIASEHGKVFSDAQGEVTRGIEVVEYACGMPHLQKGEHSMNVGTGVDSYSMYQPVGVCAGITPFNFPAMVPMWMYPIALVCGNTFILKPSERDPSAPMLAAELLKEAGLPDGVFNLVNGDGLNVGAYLSAHPDIDMVSFTGSTRAGIEVAKNAAPTVKRVAQELGGKSANIILDDACFEEAISRDAFEMCLNSGQSCNAGTRMLVPRDRMDEAARLAELGMDQLSVGDPQDLANTVGPVASEAQWIKIQELIQVGIDEGATLVCGGCGRPDGLDTGFYVRPTLFADVTNDMRIAREEIFGPVLVIIGYEDDDDAVDIANDTSYGLSGYISGSHDRALAVARRIRTGAMHLNGAGPDLHAPFGGYKQSGNGREWGRHGFEEYLETKAVLGAGS